MPLFRTIKNRIKSLRRKQKKMNEGDLEEEMDQQETEEVKEEQVEYSLEEKFRACVDIIQNLPKSGPVKSTYPEMLSMYSLFKQATEGPCNIVQPAFWNVVDRYKWDAWNRLGELSKEEAMEKYVKGALEKIDYCAEQWDWDEMLSTHAKDYDKIEPVLKRNFRIIERDYLESVDKKGAADASSTTTCPTGASSANPEERRSTEQLTVEIPNDAPLVGDLTTPADPLSDAEYCDARDHDSLSRSSSLGSLNDTHHRHSPPGRVRSLKAYCARMDVELRAINAALNALSAATDARHQSIIKLIKNSAVYIAVPSRLSWKSLFFFLVWPFIVHWAIKYFGGQAMIEKLY
ncbi:maa-1 [Pristionchus pacificus]|uniref:Maa-1 n=1 Tax=Pristionchus pacificus TaxID=54126 RepID=A0A2A6BPH7_PRIPA|nr:maa-1 [Pristionchus pacificus]|eukprot:PDM67736.1 maa-1 [Pristionchus pacificus]